MVVGTLLTTYKGAKDGWEKYSEWRDSFLDIDELDSYRQRFADKLEQVLKPKLAGNFSVDVIIDEYEAHRDEILASLKEQKITAIEPAVERLTEELGSAHLYTTLRAKICCRVSS